jgi:pimeloyl-ACP methyl ester carboxylesterase
MLRWLLVVLIAAAAAYGVYAWRTHDAPPDAAVSPYMLAADRFVEVDGARVRVREEGPADAPVIVLMHGFVYSLETWDAWAEALRADWRVIRFDLAGHGLSGPDPEQRYSPEERAAFVGDVMDALGVERAIIGGNSLGGLAAWRFAAAAPDRVRALILVSPGAYPYNGVTEIAVSPPPPMKFFLSTAPEAGVRIALAGIYADDAKVTDAKVARMRDMMRQPGNGEAYIQSIEEFTLPDPAAKLSSITAPTLILWGADDAVIPAEQGRRLAAEIPGAQLVEYPGVGHAAQEEAPEATLADVKAFLAALSTGAQ